MRLRAVLAALLFLQAGYSAEVWQRGASMPVRLGEVAAGIIEGKLYLVGEGAPGTYAYDLKTGLWDSKSLQSRPFRGDHHAAEVLGNKLYLIGGIDEGQGKVQIFDPVKESWSLGSDMPYAGGSVSSAVIDGKIYVAGGIIGSKIFQRTVSLSAVYDPLTDQWTSLPPMPYGCNHAASATDGHRLFVFGGRGGGNWPSAGYDLVQVFDPISGKWKTSRDSEIAPLPQRRGGMGKAVFVDGKFYVMGGETLFGHGSVSGGVYSRVDIYDPETNQWREGPKLKTARHGIFPVVDDGRIFVAGGGTHMGNSQSDVLEILPAGPY